MAIQFYMISEEGSDGEWLGVEEDAKYADFSRKIPFNQVTVEMMANLLDQDAESCNAHDYCGAHKGLAALLNKHIVRHKIMKVFRDLVELGGLHGMLGVAGSGDPSKAEGFLGVTFGSDGEWKLGD